MQRFPEAYRARVECADVRGVYRSTRVANLRVVDKENGGSKADASNAGINACRYPLVCVVDADSVLQPDSLRRVVRHFSKIRQPLPSVAPCASPTAAPYGRVSWRRSRLPKNFLALVQVVEYLRAFLFGRMGWSPINGLLIISGAFGLFHKETLVEAGGYNPDAVGEDMELVLRLHRLMKKKAQAVPNHLRAGSGLLDGCTRESARPEESARSLATWPGQALMLNKSLIFNRHGGAVSWVAFPFTWFSNCSDRSSR